MLSISSTLPSSPRPASSPRETTPGPNERADQPAAVVSLSPEARQAIEERAENATNGESAEGQPQAAEPRGVDAEARGVDAEADKPQGELTEDEKRQVAELSARDREVRAHEAAHKAAASGLGAGAPSFETQTGPDGRQYAVGGEVSINVSEGRTPEETVARAAQIRAAAHAPAQPSAQDMSVAAQASQMESEARAELAKQRLGGGDDTDAAAATLPSENEDEDAEASSELAFRSGGVRGGHVHPAEGCEVCASGIKAYGG